MRGRRWTSLACSFVFFFFLCLGAEAAGTIKLMDYMFPAGDGSYLTYQYIKYPSEELNFSGAPNFTVSVTKVNYGGYTGVYQVGDYYFPDNYTNNKTLYISTDKKYPGLVGTDKGIVSPPKNLPIQMKLDTVIENPWGDTNNPWYYMNIAKVTVPAGTFKNVVVKLDLDRQFGAPNAANYLFGINVPDAGVTHATWYVKGVGEIMNMDFDDNGDILFVYVLESYQITRRK